MEKTSKTVEDQELSQLIREMKQGSIEDYNNTISRVTLDQSKSVVGVGMVSLRNNLCWHRISENDGSYTVQCTVCIFLQTTATMNPYP